MGCIVVTLIDGFDSQPGVFMINGWWLVVESVIFLVLLVWTRRMAYRHGIWDGAFNHFLRVVQVEMLYYDPHRAKTMLKEEGLIDQDMFD
jgi:hypothetical protein